MPKASPKRPSYINIENLLIIVLFFLAIFFQLIGQEESLLATSLALSIICLRTLQSRSGTVVPIPFIPVVVLLVGGTSAYLYYPSIQNSALVSMDIPYDPTQYGKALVLFTVAAAAIWCGGLLTLKPASQRVEQSFWSHKQVRKWTPYILLLALVPPALVLYGFGIAGLIERRHYLHIPGSSGAVSLSLLALPIGAALVSFVIVHKATGTLARIASVGLLLAYVIVYLATGSRGLGILPIIFMLVALVIGNPRPFAGIISIITTIPLALWGVSLPLQIRLWGEGAGIRPALQFISSEHVTWKVDFGQIFGNILFGLPLAGQIIGSDRLPAFGFWTSVSPLQSGMTRWAELQPLVSWGPATPYNALGELTDYGVPYLLGYLVVVGAVFGLVNNLIMRHRGVLRQLLLLAALSTATLFSTGLLQYPLRNSTRYVWYLILIVFACSFVVLLLNRPVNRPAITHSPTRYVPTAAEGRGHEFRI